MLVCWLRFACLAQEMRTRSEWRLALVLADRVTPVTATDTGLRLARMAITAMPLMPARPMATTDLIGSSAGSSLALAHGSVDTTVADSMVVVSTAAADTTGVVADITAAGVTTGVATLVIIQAADIEAVAASRRAAVVDSTAAVAEASMVEAAEASMVEAVTDK